MKFSVLTYIFGNYEMVREILKTDQDAEYILVTDNPNLQSNTWTVVFDSQLSELSVFDKCYYVRFHPFEYVHTDICLRIDGSIVIKDQLFPIIKRFNKRNADITVMVNPVFNHIHEDYDYWINNRNYPRKCAKKCLSKLYELGYDNTYKGYYQLGFEIERKNKITKELDDMAYQLLIELGEDGVIERFDQPVWSFVLNKYFSDKIKVMPLDEYLITFSQYFSLCWHNSTEIVPYKVNQKPPYLFNHRVKVEHFDYLHGFGNYQKKLVFFKQLTRSYKERLKRFLILCKRRFFCSIQ